MPYGEMLMENTNFSYDNPYKYNAKEFDASTGYYYYGARYYDPKRSFWLSVDPLAEITNSPYAYVWNDPVNFADPTGMMGERVGGNDPCDPPAKRSFVRRTWDWFSGLFRTKHHGKVTVGMPTMSREPDLPTFSQAPGKRMPSTIGAAIQDYRDSGPTPGYGTAMGMNIMAKGAIDQILDFGNYMRNSAFNKSDYSGLGPRMTKWDGNTMSATESQDAKFNALLTADGLVTYGVMSQLAAESEVSIKNTLPVSTEGKLLGSIKNGEILMEGKTIASGNFDFVVMKDKSILLGRKHTFLSKGVDVLAAGEIKIRGGQIVGINNLSGHYLPGLDVSTNYLNIFKKSGVNVSKTHLKIYNSNGKIIKHILPK
ncbi:RHS repeat domain-containing protein [Chryseobacterium sp. GP-SGM7]|uniref:RHS repeat domain-containing protein n=1 Tax=Chryseobacterium sp. GP-SGM7 TaxID=3411323 RepID=UPI003B960B50